MLAALRDLRGEMKSAIESPLMPNRQQRVLELLRDRPALATGAASSRTSRPNSPRTIPQSPPSSCCARSTTWRRRPTPAHFDA